MSHIGSLLTLSDDEWPNVLTHFFGFVAFVIGCTLFVMKIRRRTRRARLATACFIFTATLCTMYACSTVYHASPPELKSDTLVLDNLSVFLALGGTTSSYLILARSGYRIRLHAAIWGAVAAAIAIQVIVQGSSAVVAVLAVSVTLFCFFLLRSEPSAGMGWLYIGAGVYLSGLPFLAATEIRYSHALWHVAVLLGSICHYMALRAVAPRREKPPVKEEPLVEPAERTVGAGR